MDHPAKNFSLPTWFALSLLALLGVIAYHNCLPNEMFWDDDEFILKNRFIKDFAYWPLWFKENLVAGSYVLSNYWRPLLLAVFAVEWHWWHAWVVGWHGVSLAFHTLDSIVLFFFVTRLLANRLLGLLVAVLFLLHPAHNEAIVYANSLGDPLSTLFVLSGLLLFARFRQSGKPAYASRDFLFSLLCYPLALMSKETGFVLAVLVPTTDFLLLQTGKPVAQRVQKTLSACWPYLCLAVYYVFLRATVLNFANTFNFYNENNEFTTHVGLRLLTFFKAMTQYAGFLFCPYELRVERQMPWAHALWEWDVLWGGLLVAGMLFCVFRFWKREPWVAYGFCWFFIAIAPASNVLVPINAVLYEHFLYVPMIGIWIVVLNCGLRFGRRWGSGPAAAGLKIFIIVAAVFCVINIRRNLDWRTAIGFYEQLVRYSPNYRVINNLGMEYANKGMHGKALYWYQKAIAMDPENPVAYHNIAGTYRDTGRAQLALDNFHKAIQLNPNFIFSYRSLADLYYRMGNYEESLKYLSIVGQYDPADQSARKSLLFVRDLLSRKQGKK